MNNTSLKLTPVVLHGKLRSGYFVCPEGNIWTNKGATLKKLSTCIAGGNLYPRVSITDNGKQIGTYAHRIVCETLHKFPKPEGITKKDWDATPNAVKSLMNGLYQVNHIDHDHKNHHPSNLEWVTAKQNQKKYQQHRKSNG